MFLTRSVAKEVLIIHNIRQSTPVRWLQLKLNGWWWIIIWRAPRIREEVAVGGGKE